MADTEKAAQGEGIGGLGRWVPAPSVLSRLPGDREELLGAADQALVSLDRGMLDGDANAVRDALAMYRASIWRANGETEHGCQMEGAPGSVFAERLGAAPGDAPTWGREGSWIEVVDGTRVLVKSRAVEGHGSVSLSFVAVDLDLPFLSETGFRTCFLPLAPDGRTFSAAVRDTIAELMVKRVYVKDLPVGELPDWLYSLTPPPRRVLRSPDMEVPPMQTEISLTNAPLEGVSLPGASFTAEVTPGSVKAIKASTRRSDAFIFLDLDRLTVMDDLNLRVHSPEYQQRIRVLADDMKDNGFRLDKPISCFIHREGDSDRVVVFDGHTRRLAALLARSEGAEISEVPVALLPKSTSMNDLLVGLAIANSGAPLSMLELSLLVKRLQGRGLSNPAISQKLHVTTTHVDKLAVLAGAPESLKMMVAANQVSATTVIDLIGAIGAERALAQLAEQLARAKGEGKGRVTAKNLPAMQFQRAVKRHAPGMFDTLGAVKADPGYGQLSTETRERLEALTAELDQLRAHAEGKGPTDA